MLLLSLVFLPCTSVLAQQLYYVQSPTLKTALIKTQHLQITNMKTIFCKINKHNIGMLVITS